MDSFPQEILIEILRNVDRGKKQLSLVSKSFYNAFSSLNEDVLLVINSKVLDDESIYKSILETTQRIRSIEMELKFDQKSENKKKQVLRIIEKQSKNITQLVINGSFSKEFLEEVFKFIPKLYLLNLEHVFITRYDSTYRNMNKPEEFNLRQVKKLIIPIITSYTTKYILDMMNNLDYGTLNDLKVVMSSQDYTKIHEFIEKQPNLKSLKLVQDNMSLEEDANIILPSTFLYNCDLENLEWQICVETVGDAQRDIVNSILKRMKKLKVLKLYHSNNSLEDFTIERFSIITENRNKLETLEIYAQDIDPTAIANLNKLTKLRNLTLDFAHLSSHQSSLISSFNQVTLPLESFSALNVSYFSAKNFIERISTTFLQNVRKLTFDIPRDAESFKAIFRYFPQVESLTIHRKYKSPKLVASFPPELQNLNLKELNVTFSLDCSIKPIRELSECFPNIEKLSLICVGLGDSGLNLLLRNLRMLKYLKLEVPYSSKVPFDKRMNSILTFGQNLEVLIYLAEIGDTDILKIFKDKFEYIKIKSSELTMATNRKIFNSYSCVEHL